MKARNIVIAACAPAAHGFVAREHEEATVRMIGGRERDPAAIADHVDRLLAHHERLLHRAGTAGAHLAVLPEDVLRLGGLIRRHRRVALCREAVSAAHVRLLDRFGAICRRHRMYVAAGTPTARDGTFFNSAVLLDTRGRVIATYDKTHLPPNERMTYDPGASLPVFDTPLGRIGLLICWDIVFPESYATLALQGAELIVEPTFGHSSEADDMTARCRARDWSVPLAIGMWGGRAGVIDANGEYVARTGSRPNRIAVATLDLAARRRWLFFRDTRRQKPALRRPEIYR